MSVRPAVRCPTCSASPPPTFAWRCVACEERFDPFATSACCPRCAVVWPELDCPSCDARAPQVDWYLEQGPRQAFAALSAPPSRATDLWDVLTTDLVSLFEESSEPADPRLERARLLLVEEELERLVAREETLVDQIQELERAPTPRRTDALEQELLDLRGLRREVTEERDAAHAIAARAAWSVLRTGTASPSFDLRIKASEALGGVRRFFRERIGGEPHWPGLAALERDDYAGAIRECEALLASDPSQGNARYGLGVARLRLGDPAGAEEALTLFLAHAPEVAVGYQQRASARVEQKAWEGALDDLNEAIRLDPKRPWPWSARAGVRLELEQLALALADYQQAFALSGLGRHLMHCAYVRSDLGDLEAARRDCEAALDLDYAQPYAHTLHAGLLLDLDGDVAGAIAATTRSFRLEPSDSAYSALTRAYLRLGDGEPGRALLDLRHALALDPNHVDARTCRAYLRFLRGDDPGARVDLLHAAEHEEPTDAQGRVRLPWAQARLAALGLAPLECPLPDDLRWEWDLARYLQGELAADELIPLLASKPGKDLRSRLCVAQVFLALAAERAGDVEAAKARYQAAAAANAGTTPEWFVARYRLHEAPAEAPPTPEPADLVGQLERLATLLESGHLNRDEFDRLKRALIDDD